MSSPLKTIIVNAQVEITEASLEAVVQNAKQMAAQGIPDVDPADVLSAIISRFLLERDFEAYTKDPVNYAV